jgi:integrase
MPLTDPAIKATKPGPKPYKVADAGGLYLEIFPNGSRYWRLKYRHAGKEKRLALGVYPAVTLKEAREKREAAKKILGAGEDPAGSMTKREKKRAARLKTENSFEALAREWWGHKKGQWAGEHAERIMASLEMDVLPIFGHRPITEITPPEVLDVVRAIERRGALDVASRVQQRIKSVFRYAVQTGRATVNPSAELAGVLMTRKVQHREALDRETLPAFVRKLEAYPGTPEVKQALKLLMLTFVRPGELRGACWEEFDLDGKVWRIPGERMKMKAPHLVPLSRQALALLEDLRPLTGRFALLFPGANDRERPLSENTLNDAIRKRLGFQATSHGFRATASTILNEAGYRPDAIERQLAHAERNKVRAAYHRTEYLEERTKMMQAWADYLDALKVENVVPFKAKAA